MNNFGKLSNGNWTWFLVVKDTKLTSPASQVLNSPVLGKPGRQGTFPDTLLSLHTQTLLANLWSLEFSLGSSPLITLCAFNKLSILFSQLGQRGQCQTSYTSSGPIRLVHQGCYSTRAHKLRYCGLCTDSRCCTPSHTTTDEVTFQCPSGRQLKRAVMVIHSCACHDRCPYAPFHNPALWGYRPWLACMDTWTRPNELVDRQEPVSLNTQISIGFPLLIWNGYWKTKLLKTQRADHWDCGWWIHCFVFLVFFLFKSKKNVRSKNEALKQA